MRVDENNFDSVRVPGNMPIRTFLDGNEMHHVCELDEEAGYLVMAVLDVHGDAIVDPRDDSIRTMRLEGLVQVTMRGEELSPEQRDKVAALHKKTGTR